MTYACLFPDQVNRLISLDASPVDRTDVPHLNAESAQMIEQAMAIAERLEGLSLPDAVKLIKAEAAADPVLLAALLFNLNRDGSLMCDVKAIFENQEHIFGFPELDSTFEGPTLMLNGA